MISVFGKSELTEWGHREALRQAEEEARDINDLVTQFQRRGLPVKVVLGSSGWLRIESIPFTRREP